MFFLNVPHTSVSAHTRQRVWLLNQVKIYEKLRFRLARFHSSSLNRTTVQSPVNSCWCYFLPSLGSFVTFELSTTGTNVSFSIASLLFSRINIIFCFIERRREREWIWRIHNRHTYVTILGFQSALCHRLRDDKGRERANNNGYDEKA